MGRSGRVEVLRNEEVELAVWSLAENLEGLLVCPGGPVAVRDHELSVAQPQS